MFLNDLFLSLPSNIYITVNILHIYINFFMDILLMDTSILFLFLYLYFFVQVMFVNGHVVSVMQSKVIHNINHGAINTMIFKHAKH